MDRASYRAALALSLLGSLAITALVVHLAHGAAPAPLFFGLPMSQKDDKGFPNPQCAGKGSDALFAFFTEERKAAR